MKVESVIHLKKRQQLILENESQRRRTSSVLLSTIIRQGSTDQGWDVLGPAGQINLLLDLHNFPFSDFMLIGHPSDVYSSRSGNMYLVLLCFIYITLHFHINPRSCYHYFSTKEIACHVCQGLPLLSPNTHSPPLPTGNPTFPKCRITIWCTAVFITFNYRSV